MLLFCVNQQFHARLLRKSNAIRLFRSVPLSPLLPQPPLFPLSSMFRIFFQVPYPVTLLFATLTKNAGGCTNNSQKGTAPFAIERNSHELANRNNHSYSEFCPAPLPAAHSQRTPLPHGRL